MDDQRYDLWEYLADEFDVIALDGQIEEIIRLALPAYGRLPSQSIRNKQRRDRWRAGTAEAMTPASFFHQKLENLNNMDELRELCAAYEAAMNCDYCPGPAEAAELAGEIETDFTADEFRRGAKKNQGRRPDEIARSIIRAAGRLKKQHAALEQLARRTNYTVTYDNSSRRFEVVYNRAMNYYTADADLEVAALKALDRLNSKK